MDGINKEVLQFCYLERKDRKYQVLRGRNPWKETKINLWVTLNTKNIEMAKETGLLVCRCIMHEKAPRSEPYYSLVKKRKQIKPVWENGFGQSPSLFISNTKPSHYHNHNWRQYQFTTNYVFNHLFMLYQGTSILYVICLFLEVNS